ncbi:MAG: methyltransferase domain-containing protein [Rudaea sp.]|nr:MULTISPECIES: methyltransferase domain-containing protein [unclassified Rudaea]MBN8888138.1 methyltransferase domain-containing protein [Rudaea sp.]
MSEQISAFSHVDSAAQTGALVEFLDRTAADHFGEINRRSFDLLHLRDGAAVLDVGCGTGDDVRAMRAEVGARGCATGIDLSRRMVEEALARDCNSTFASRFLVGDVRSLAFADGAFDACRISRVLLHVDDPETALGEAARVVRSGGRIVAVEPDFDTLTLAHPDRATTRAVLDAFCDSFAHGGVGKWLAIWLRRLGMSEIRCEPRIVPIDAGFLRKGFQIEQMAKRACELGAIDEERRAGFLRTLDDLAAREEFFCAATVLLVSATRP